MTQVWVKTFVIKGVPNVISVTDNETPIEVAVTCEMQGNIPHTVRIMIVRTSMVTPLS